MISVSKEYKNACSSTNRPQSFITAKYGSFDKNIKNNIGKIDSDNKLFCNENKLYNEIKSTNYNYISCEPDRVKLDGTFYFIDNKLRKNTNENIAYWSYGMTDSNGEISNFNQILIDFKTENKFSEITLYFQELCTDFSVYYFLKNQHFLTRNITNNNKLIVSTQGVEGETINSNFDKIFIVFKKTEINKYSDEEWNVL